MKVTVQKLEQSEVELTVVLPWENWNKHIDQAVKKIAKEVKIPGFRPGKVPQNIIEQKYGKVLILNDAAELAIQSSYPEVLRQEKIDAIGRPQAEIKTAEEGKDLEYTVKTAVMPEVKIKDWKNAVKKVNKEYGSKKASVSEEEVEKELNRLIQSRAKAVTVNREARKGDSVEVDFEVLRDGVVIENGTGRNHPLILGSDSFIPGFEEAIEGMKAGESKEFELAFPEKYHAADLAGKKATFKVTLGVVQEREIPAVDDAFAQSLGNFENLEALKNNFRDGLLQDKQMRLDEEHQEKIVEALIEATEAIPPKVLIDEETHKMIHEFESQVQSMGMDFKEYLEKLGKSHGDLHKDWEPQAIKRIKAGLALEEVAKEEEIEVSADVVEAEMNKTLQYYKSMKEIDKNLDLEKLYGYVKGKLKNEAVFEALKKM